MQPASNETPSAHTITLNTAAQALAEYVSSLPPNAARILYDVSKCLFEHFDIVESSVVANDFEVGAGITIKVQWKPATEKEEACVETTSTSSTKSIVHKRSVRHNGSQLELI